MYKEWFSRHRVTWRRSVGFERVRRRERCSAQSRRRGDGGSSSSSPTNGDGRGAPRVKRRWRVSQTELLPLPACSRSVDRSCRTALGASVEASRLCSRSLAFERTFPFRSPVPSAHDLLSYPAAVTNPSCALRGPFPLRATSSLPAPPSSLSTIPPNGSRTSFPYSTSSPTSSCHSSSSCGTKSRASSSSAPGKAGTLLRRSRNGLAVLLLLRRMVKGLGGRGRR